jgi:integrase
MPDPHIVSLSAQVLSILEKRQPISTHREHLFLNKANPTMLICEHSLLYEIYRMGYYSHPTAHGFRAAASTILSEHSFAQ